MNTNVNEQGVPIGVDLLVMSPNGVFVGYKDGVNTQPDVFFLREHISNPDKRPYAIVGCTAWAKINHITFNEVK